jgi:hypothetical protein
MALWDFLFGGAPPAVGPNPQGQCHGLDNISSSAVAEGSRNDTIARASNPLAAGPLLAPLCRRTGHPQRLRFTSSRFADRWRVADHLGKSSGLRGRAGDPIAILTTYPAPSRRKATVATGPFVLRPPQDLATRTFSRSGSKGQEQGLGGRCSGEIRKNSNEVWTAGVVCFISHEQITHR